jgi:hypothetical protein
MLRSNGPLGIALPLGFLRSGCTTFWPRQPSLCGCHQQGGEALT